MTARSPVLRRFKDRYEDLQKLVGGIAVDSITTFDLETCAPEEPISEVLGRMREKRIDQMPVEPGRSQYVQRPSLEAIGPGCCIADAELEPLTLDGVLAASTPMAEVLPLLLGWPFFFVLRCNRIEGIVTPGDLQRAPFRMYLFGLMGLLELAVTELVLENDREENWQHLPNIEGALKDLKKWWRKAQSQGEEPRYKFEVVALDNKLAVLQESQAVLRDFPDAERAMIIAAKPVEIGELRNNVAHAKDLTEKLDRRWCQVIELAGQLDRLTQVVSRKAWGRSE